MRCVSCGVVGEPFEHEDAASAAPRDAHLVGAVRRRQRSERARQRHLSQRARQRHVSHRARQATRVCVCVAATFCDVRDPAARSAVRSIDELLIHRAMPRIILVARDAGRDAP